MPTDDRYFGKTIEEHCDAGTCWLCGKAVDYSQGWHTTTGGHWSCVATLRREVESFARNARTAPYLARANGGHYIHTIDPKSDVSLCGHSPRDTARRMRSRGRWIEVRDVPRGYRRCPHCERLIAAKHVVEQGSGDAARQPVPSDTNKDTNRDTDRDTRTRDLFEDEMQ
ncbi:hypothetical protein [Cupriavidus pampae]|uniref:Uncharacterized protein n=1 Tax=Cupriavidus pampae TaxID=659251 RepID=A0ABN7ZNZ0_9BURK|nr:hypothetical protein [Cupriavidus pampae]CAG9186031.1 hypothetical protein LMG32289_06226 [Cupriavidus pampae]